MSQPSQAQLLAYLGRIAYPTTAAGLRDQLTHLGVPPPVFERLASAPEQTYTTAEDVLSALPYTAD